MIKQHHTRLSKSPKRLLTVACSAAIAAGFNSLPTIAQNELALEEVIVSATRRDESFRTLLYRLQRSPENWVKRRCVDSMICRPSAQALISDAIQAPVALRLLTFEAYGTTDYDKSLDPPIGVIMDGLFLGTASGVLMQNFDIERIEILRGPQGTLFR